MPGIPTLSQTCQILHFNCESKNSLCKYRVGGCEKHENTSLRLKLYNVNIENKIGKIHLSQIYHSTPSLGLTSGESEIHLRYAQKFLNMNFSSRPHWLKLDSIGNVMLYHLQDENPYPYLNRTYSVMIYAVFL